MKVSSFTTFVSCMVLAVLGVAAIAYWDASRESAAALEDFAEEPLAIATGIASLRAGAERDPLDSAELATLASVERAGARRVFVRHDGDKEFIASDGSRHSSTTLTAGFASGASTIRLSRPDAAELGLPERTAAVGLRGFAWHDRRFEVAVVESAARERDREDRTQHRLLLSIVLGAGLVLGFGVAALRRQKLELERSRELAVAAVARERDERLGRADKLATMGALATGIAHEISTPLGVIVARAEAVSASDDPKAKRAASIILEQSDRISATIRGFLGIARGRTPPLVRTGATELAERAAELTEHRFEQGGVHMKLDIAPGVASVSCDPLLFEQVLVNLLLNACDASGPGGNVVLRVESRDERVAFVVSDDGPGISVENAARALEPFFTTKSEGKGTGLGLVIASEIVKHHNGTLSIAPRAPRGTDATVLLPAEKEARDE